MYTKTFSFDLPQELIAQYPLKERSDSRLMHLDCSESSLSHHLFRELPDLLPKDALLIFNNTKVRKVRLKAETEGGASVELFFLEACGGDEWLVLLSRAKRHKIGRELLLPEELRVQITGIEEGGERRVKLSRAMSESEFESYLERNGGVPLPPYMRRDPENEDLERYQTVYARFSGSAAAPTAGLHFSEESFRELEARGIESSFITLHVGMGTFAPIRSERLEDHQMHREMFEIEEAEAVKIAQAKREKRPIIAVGTTVIRTLESAWSEEEKTLRVGKQSTDLFISPGYQFGLVDGIFTNFHTPESSLMVLISTFAGVDFLKEAYQQAIEERYRFFSYGDCMLLTK